MHRPTTGTFAAAWLFVGILMGACPAEAAPATPDPRLREVWYSPQQVVSVPVKRGVVTLVALDADEVISEVGSGLGADCSKPDAAWCIAAQPGGRFLFVKPKQSASAANTLAVVTDRRTHSFRFVVLADGDAREPVYRIQVKAPRAMIASPAAVASPPSVLPLPPPAEHEATADQPSEQALVTARLDSAPVPVNAAYSLAEGEHSQDILPTLVFDDGRFTYFRFPNNREVPSVFHVLGDGAETLVNSRMEGDLLVVDRVSRRLMLRAGTAVVGVWNDRFDLDGAPPQDGTTVAGMRRVLKGTPPSAPAPTMTSERTR